MALVSLVKQVFRLKSQYDKYEKTYSGKIDDPEKLQYGIQRRRELIGTINTAEKNIAKQAVNTAQFVYNYTVDFARFGYRGKDIQDQTALQDKLVNKAFGITGAFVFGGPVAGVTALVSSAITEVLQVVKSNARYEYNKSIDTEQKDIMQERIGRAVYNSSRR